MHFAVREIVYRNSATDMNEISQQMPSRLRDNKIASLLYNFLLKWQHLENHPRMGRLWRRVWQAACDRITTQVSTNIHGRRAIVNFGHTYPLYARRYKRWNNPLLELVNQVHHHKKRPINIIDVGAAIGDTVLLIEANCIGMVENYYCVEGEAEFFNLLVENIGSWRTVHAINALLSDKLEDIPTLTRTHAGTASAQGDLLQGAVPLDSLFCGSKSDSMIDVLKIDVDGFDGRVLRGSTGILEKHRPAVIFEWDPFLCQRTENGWLDHFIRLNESSYHRFVWFSKYGDFSHFTSGLDNASVNRMATVCLSNQHDFNWHYDIVALPDEAPEMEQQLAALSFAKQRRSFY